MSNRDFEIRISNIIFTHIINGIYRMNLDVHMIHCEKDSENINNCLLIIHNNDNSIRINFTLDNPIIDCSSDKITFAFNIGKLTNYLLKQSETEQKEIVFFKNSGIDDLYVDNESNVIGKTCETPVRFPQTYYPLYATIDHILLKKILRHYDADQISDEKNRIIINYKKNKLYIKCINYNLEIFSSEIKDVDLNPLTIVKPFRDEYQLSSFLTWIEFASLTNHSTLNFYVRSSAIVQDLSTECGDFHLRILPTNYDSNKNLDQSQPKYVVERQYAGDDDVVVVSVTSDVDKFIDNLRVSNPDLNYVAHHNAEQVRSDDNYKAGLYLIKQNNDTFMLYKKSDKEVIPGWVYGVYENVPFIHVSTLRLRKINFNNSDIKF